MQCQFMLSSSEIRRGQDMRNRLFIVQLQNEVNRSPAGPVSGKPFS